MHVLGYRGREAGETAAARAFDDPFDAAAPVVASRSGRRQATGRMYGRFGPRVSLLPDGVVSRKEPVDARGLLLQGTNVEGQHSHEKYPRRRSGSSRRVAVSYPHAGPPQCSLAEFEH